jgi:hypothetical protein
MTAGFSQIIFIYDNEEAAIRAVSPLPQRL